MAKVFVSGANGFIAQHIIKILLERGYSVVGSVRSSAKGEALTANFNSPKLTIEVIPDLIAEDAFDAALKKHTDIEYFLHTASPVTWQAEDFERDIVIPAVKGTKNALVSIKKYAPQIKKLVYTSSNAAVSTVGDTPDVVLDETSWNRKAYEESLSNGSLAYRISKTVAEKSTWSFIETEKPNFKLTTIAPPFVLGPQAFKTELSDVAVNFSNNAILGLLKLKPEDSDKIPALGSYFVDVRSLALAHVLAIENPETDGQRLIVSKDRFTSQQLLDIIREKFPDLASKLPAGQPKKYNYAFATLNNAKSNKILKLDYLDLDETVVETVKQYLSVYKV